MSYKKLLFVISKIKLYLTGNVDNVSPPRPGESAAVASVFEELKIKLLKKPNDDSRQKLNQETVFRDALNHGTTKQQREGISALRMYQSRFNFVVATLVSLLPPPLSFPLHSVYLPRLSVVSGQHWRFLPSIVVTPSIKEI